jgi:polyferredoxin
VSLFAFVGLLVSTQWHSDGSQPPRAWFLQADPLAAIVSWLSPLKPALGVFVPAAVVLLLTVLLGRVFCGWICPLGTTIDVADKALWRKRKRRPAIGVRPALKFYVLGASLVAALAGTQLAWILDPIPLLTRTFATVLYPVGTILYNIGVLHGRPLLRAVGVRAYPVEAHPFALTVLTTAVFAIILGLGYFSRRYWCRTLCPLGALLAFAGRFGLLRRQVDESCVKCRRCHTECKMGAIPDREYQTTRAPECIQCFDCLTCPKSGIASIGFGRSRTHYDPATRASRRYFIAACSAGAVYAVAARWGVRQQSRHERLIRPPGANLSGKDGIQRRMTEEEFRALCLRCGECMKACPTGGLQPAVMEAGFDGVFTPVLVPRLGWCEQNCNACGTVCPSGALVPFRVENKPQIKLGRAEIDHSKCLAWQAGDNYKECLVCDEQCSYKAIEIRPHQGGNRPFVDHHRCVGCGMCENKCPAKPTVAITVHREEHMG